MCNRLTDLGLKLLEINKEEKQVLVVALKLLDCKAKTMQIDTASICNEERELNCVVLSHVCDRLTDKIEALFALPAVQPFFGRTKLTTLSFTAATQDQLIWILSSIVVVDSPTANLSGVGRGRRYHE